MELSENAIPEGLRTSQKLKKSSFHDDLRTVQKPNANKVTLMSGTPDTLPETPYSIYNNTPFSSSVRNFSEPIFSFSDGIFSPVGGVDLQNDLSNHEETSSIDKSAASSPTTQKPLTSKRMMINSLGAIARSPTPKKNDEPRQSKRSIMMAFWDVAKTPPRKEKSLEQLYEAVADSTIKKTLTQDDEKATMTPSLGRKLCFSEDFAESENNFNGPNYASKYLSQFNADSEEDEDLLLTPQSSPMKKKTSPPQSGETNINLSNYLAQFDDEENEDLLITPQSSPMVNKSSTPQSNSVSYLSNYLAQFDDDENEEDDELLLTPLKERISTPQSMGSNYASKYLLQLDDDKSEDDEDLSFSLNSSSQQEVSSIPQSRKMSSSNFTSPGDLLLDTSKEVHVGQGNHENELTLDEIHFNKMRSKVKPAFSSLPDCAVTPDGSVRSGSSIYDPTNIPSLLSLYSRNNMDSDDEDSEDEILQLSKMRSKLKPNLTSLPDCDVTPSTVRSAYSARDPLTLPDLLSPRSINDSDSQDLEHFSSSTNKKKESPNSGNIQNLRSSIIKDAAKLRLDPHLTKQIMEVIDKSDLTCKESEKQDLAELSMVINSDNDDVSEVSSLGSRSMMSKSTVLSEVLDKAMKTFASLDDIMKDFKRLQHAAAMDTSQSLPNNTEAESPCLKAHDNNTKTQPSFGAVLTPMKVSLNQQAKKLSPVKEAPTTPVHHHSKSVSFSDKLSPPIKPKKKQSAEDSDLIDKPEDPFRTFDADQNWVSFSPPKISLLKRNRSSNAIIRTSKPNTQDMSSSVQETVLSDFEKLQRQINATNQRMKEEKKNLHSRHLEEDNVDTLLKNFHQIKQMASNQRWNKSMPSLMESNLNGSAHQRPPVHRMSQSKPAQIQTDEFNENRLWFAEFDKDGFLVKQHEEQYSSLLKQGKSVPELESKKQLYNNIDTVDKKKKSKTKKLIKRLKKLITKTRKADKDEGSLGIESVQSNMTSDTKKKKRFNFLKKLKRKKNSKPTDVAINACIPCDVSHIDEEELKKTLEDMNMALSDLDVDSSDMSCSDSDLSQNCSSSSLNEDGGDIGYAWLG